MRTFVPTVFRCPHSRRASYDGTSGFIVLQRVLPGKTDVHPDEGGPVCVGGKEAWLKRFTSNYCEVRSGTVTIVVDDPARRQSPRLLKGKGSTNAVC